ncbi:MAG: 2-C-methyl-D-erythritol 2,4-cyclodiphosphate synthase [Acidimicrobiales bacterium]
MAHRVGIGFDVHPFSDEPSRPLVLGGVLLTGEPGLAGHSDADVVAHAVTDALLGAAGLGDIGQYFPDRDPAWRGADSLDILARAAQMVNQLGWKVGNADCSVVLDTPRLAPHREAMAAKLSSAAGGPVSVKAKRAEGLGALGRGEGIACWAVAVVEGPG